MRSIYIIYKYLLYFIMCTKQNKTAFETVTPLHQSYYTLYFLSVLFTLSNDHFISHSTLNINFIYLYTSQTYFRY